MEKHPKLVLDRIEFALNEIRQQIWADERPLTVSVFQCQDPIPHDEAIRQEFAPVTAGYKWGPAWSTAWFHVQGDYPAEWAGSTVAMLFDTGTEALVWQNGAPAQGLESNRKDFVLEYAAAGAGTIDLYIEAAGNHLFGVNADWDGTPFTLSTIFVARQNTPMWDLFFDLQILCNLAKSLPEDSPRRAKLILALNDAVVAYRRGGDNAVADARAILAVEYTRPADASASTVNALGHSHIDTAWLWPLRETVRKCSRTFSTVLKYMERYPEYRYVQSQPQLYAFVKEHYPALFARIKQAVAEGRWEPQGAMWVEADCNVTSGESFVRQILYGTKFFREEFGVENTILWLPDVFGYSAALPQILQQSGIPYFMTQKISWSQFNKFPHHTFWWEGIDGSRVLTHFLPTDTYNANMLPDELLRGEKNFKDKDRSGTWLNLFGFGDGGGGATKDMLEAIRREGNVEGLPKVQQTLARDWFPQMEAEANDLCTWAGELYLEAHRGTYTTQAKNKWENRRCEFLLRDAEFLATINPDGAASYPHDELEHAWKLVLLNQFHDILPGSSIPWVYEDSTRQYAEVHQIGEGAVDTALDTFAGAIDTTKLKHPVMTWNTLSFARSGLVSLPWNGNEPMVALTPRDELTRTQPTEENGEQRLLVELADVPSMGYTIYDLLPGEVPDGVTPLITDTVCASDRVLENGLVRVEFNDYGGVVSYYDKQMEREIIPEGTVANMFQRFDDHPTWCDAWELDFYFEDTQQDLTTPGEITVVEQGPLRAMLRVERELNAKAKLVQLIKLEANSRRLDFETFIDWHEEHALLKVAFPIDIYTKSATYEIQYGHVERPTHRNTSWDVARFEVPAQKWVDLSESDFGVALLNDGKYGHDTHRNVMRLTLLRAPKSPDPQADMGSHHFTYSLLPHRGNVENSGIPLAGYDFNVPLLAKELPVQEGMLARTHSYFKLDKPNLIIEAVKRAEDGDGIIVRLYEAYRRQGKARLITNGLCSRVTRTDLMERNQEDLEVAGGAVHLTFRPFEIITLRLR